MKVSDQVVASVLVAAVLAGGLVVLPQKAAAQNAPKGATTAPIPTGRLGRGGYPLPPLPAVFETYQHKVRVSIVARGLDRPWSLLMLPNDDMLVSMRFSNQIRLIRDGVLDPKPVSGLPEMRRLFDIVLHPQFAQNNWVYFDYSKAGTGARTPLALARAVRGGHRPYRCEYRQNHRDPADHVLLQSAAAEEPKDEANK